MFATELPVKLTAVVWELLQTLISDGLLNVGLGFIVITPELDCCEQSPVVVTE